MSPLWHVHVNRRKINKNSGANSFVLNKFYYFWVANTTKQTIL